MKNVCFSLILTVVCAPALAHEGHDTPGALPPPPNGGRLAEAEHAYDHRESAKEDELFVEGKLMGNALRVYAHALGAESQGSFKSLKPGEVLNLVDAKIELPRAKKIVAVTAIKKAEFWEIDVSRMTEKRLILHMTLVSGAERKTAKLQVER